MGSPPSHYTIVKRGCSHYICSNLKDYGVTVIDHKWRSKCHQKGIKIETLGVQGYIFEMCLDFEQDCLLMFCRSAKSRAKITNNSTCGRLDGPKKHRHAIQCRDEYLKVRQLRSGKTGLAKHAFVSGTTFAVGKGSGRTVT